MDQLLVLLAVGDELLDADDLQAVCAEPKRLRSGRRDIVPSERMISQSTPAGYSPASFARSTGRLGLPGAHQHAAFARAQREQVPRHDVVVRGRLRVDEHLHGARAVRGRDAGRDASRASTDDRERRAEVRGVVAVFTIIGMPSSSMRSPVIGMQIRPRPYSAMKLIGRRSELRRHGEVAFVLAVLVIDDDDEAARLIVNNRFFDCR